MMMGTGMVWMVLVLVVVILVVLGVFALWNAPARGAGGKRKRDAEEGEYLDEFLAQGDIHLGDDGELSALDEDDAYWGEKPKRSDEE